MTCFYTYIDYPAGRMLVRSDGVVLTGLSFVGQKHAPTVQPGWINNPALDIFSVVSNQLYEYWQGSRHLFTVPYRFTEGTVFQRNVWQALANIPYGQTCSYSTVAESIGRPTGVRAVAVAIAHNPLAIIVPCHRVVGKMGDLRGYAGGIPRKKDLLLLERDHHKGLDLTNNKTIS